MNPNQAEGTAVLYAFLDGDEEATRSTASMLLQVRRSFALGVAPSAERTTTPPIVNRP